MGYERLLMQTDIEVIETNHLPSFQSGMYYDGTIYIKEKMNLLKKHETLAEELGHHHLTYGDITDQKILMNRKYELKARRYGYELLVSLDDLISAYKDGVHNMFEMSNYFDVSEGYIIDVLNHYKMKYGISTYHNGYVIKFEPLQVFKHIQFE
ncbi:ImmA/IrrE family metallo-endopeptidase [Mammaliicoccus sciuri]|uniref:ImmA/IrrE family metallo-endopeptidase n=1 Tax=Mammaliicoccus sciuri TaxID=1296 RepID=UPI001FB55FFE|nr:ImmA/IrrE family metallo-endopeptidase [Mammaliicoccus sciuri]MCJ1774646.1 ImmA/IrrE family metallo-endopeptidase [Mammaliicoccus sciuri]